MALLENLKPQGQTDLNASLARFALRTSRPGLVIILSDFFSDAGYEDGFKRLRYAKHEVVLIQTLAPQEISPELLGDVRLVDMETQVGIDVTANRAVLQAYAKRLRNYLDDLQNFAHTHGAKQVLANTQTNFEDLVLRQFRSLGLAK
jgi:hypothetical protein